MFLIKSLLQGKNVLHVTVEHVGEEKRIFKNERWSTSIENLIQEINPLPTNTWDHDHVSKVFIREIEQSLNN